MTDKTPITPEVMVVISAAVAVTLGKRARIRHIRYWAAQPESTWATQGRAMIMASHVIKRKRFEKD